MRDVAQKAGVSIKTVSRVVNDQGEIADSTRQRVLVVIEELGYRPNLIARGLVTQRTYTVGLVVNDITNPFFPEVARGVQDIARSNNYNIFLCNSDDDLKEEKRTLQTLAAQSVDGVIIFPSLSGNDNVEAFVEPHRPFVIINRTFEHPHVSMVMTNNHQGATLATKHLISRGHTEIGMISGQPSEKSQRVSGFEDTMLAHGLNPAANRIIFGPPTLESGLNAALHLLRENPDITAIFAYNDLLAAGAIQACKKLGRRVPDDCAIVGFDDIRLASLIDPPLTTVRLKKYELGQRAMQRMLEMLENTEESFPRIDLEVELVIRQST